MTRHVSDPIVPEFVVSLNESVPLRLDRLRRGGLHFMSGDSDEL